MISLSVGVGTEVRPGLRRRRARARMRTHTTPRSSAGVAHRGPGGEAGAGSRRWGSRLGAERARYRGDGAGDGCGGMGQSYCEGYIWKRSDQAAGSGEGPPSMGGSAGYGDELARAADCGGVGVIHMLGQRAEAGGSSAVVWNAGLDLFLFPTRLSYRLPPHRQSAPTMGSDQQPRPYKCPYHLCGRAFSPPRAPGMSPARPVPLLLTVPDPPHPHPHRRKAVSSAPSPPARSAFPAPTSLPATPASTTPMPSPPPPKNSPRPPTSV